MNSPASLQHGSQGARPEVALIQDDEIQIKPLPVKPLVFVPVNELHQPAASPEFDEYALLAT